MRGATIVGFAGICLLLLAGGAAATPGSTTKAKTRWRGIEAVLPANAETPTNQYVAIHSVSCASAGSCSAVGT
jgi:dihydroxyacid dehydratase/phosphogluconate dehydratase